MEAISHAGTVLAVLSKEGIAMAAEKVRAHFPLRLISADALRKSRVNCSIFPLHQEVKEWEVRVQRHGWAEEGKRSSS